MGAGLGYRDPCMHLAKAGESFSLRADKNGGKILGERMIESESIG